MGLPIRNSRLESTIHKRLWLEANGVTWKKKTNTTGECASSERFPHFLHFPLWTKLQINLFLCVIRASCGKQSVGSLFVGIKDKGPLQHIQRFLTSETSWWTETQRYRGVASWYEMKAKTWAGLRSPGVAQINLSNLFQLEQNNNVDWAWIQTHVQRDSCSIAHS